MNLSRMTAAALLALLGACSSSPKEEAQNARESVERKYGKPAADVSDATVSAFKSSDLRIDSDRHDDLGGEVVARRADGHRVTAKVTALDPKSSRVSLRVEPGNEDLAQVLHERIADKLGMGKAKPALFGGNSLEGNYGVDLSAAVSAAERSCRALRQMVTAKEILDHRAHVDARAEDSTPLRYEMSPSGKYDLPTRVRFIAGHGKTETSKTLASGMKAEFERQVAEQVK